MCMFREKRSREKLQSYYIKYLYDDVINPNVHPWVAESWRFSRARRVATEAMPPLRRLSREELAERQKRHGAAIHYLQGMYQDISEHFTRYDLSLLLLDNECYALMNYAMPFYHLTPSQLEGARLAEEDIGTSSIALTVRHRVPFLMFGPEMWIRECQEGDACSAPVLLNGELHYIVTLVAGRQTELPHSAMVALLLTMKNALENYLVLEARLAAQAAILDAVPHAVYHILPGGEVAYTNKLGRSRLAGIAPVSGETYPNLNDVVLNYQHTPLHKGFLGIPSHNKEVTWITPQKTYEDITTVVPLSRDGAVSGIVAVSQPIEDLRTLVAHAVGYTARYSMGSLVGGDSVFLSMKDKAARVARSGHHVLLQGEEGTGKQRLAHGIHQASPRAAGPLICLRCGDMPAEVLEGELFGVVAMEESRPGKLELANGGTLFLDEVEKIPYHLQERLAGTLTSAQSQRIGEAVVRPVSARVIAACDSDLKRLTERGVFDTGLYEIISRTTVKIPPLRARKEDIPLLAEHIIGELAQQHAMAGKQLTPAAAEILISYDWPGNIKQLQGVVEQAFFQTTGDTINGGDIILPGDLMTSKAWKEDRQIFIDAWKAAGGNISRLANMLDVSRVTLYRYIRKYGLER